MASWKRLDQKIIFSHPRITLVEDTVKLPDTSTTNYLRFENLEDYVTIIPLDNDGMFTLLHEYAYPTDQELIQFPDGGIKDNEDVIAAAIRELKEETGLVSNDVVIIGTNLGHHRRSTVKNYVMLVRNAYDGGPMELEAEEESITIHKYSEQEINQMIASGKIIQKNTLAAWATYLAGKSNGHW